MNAHRRGGSSQGKVVQLFGVVEVAGRTGLVAPVNRVILYAQAIKSH